MAYAVWPLLVLRMQDALCSQAVSARTNNPWDKYLLIVGVRRNISRVIKNQNGATPTMADTNFG